MEFEIVNKLIHTKPDGTKQNIGFCISLGGTYSCSVTVEKASELCVRDIEIAHLMDYSELDVIPIERNKYGVVSNNSGFFEDFADSPFDYFGDRKLYYGYYFEDRFIVTLDSSIALKRMISEVNGGYYDV